MKLIRIFIDENELDYKEISVLVNYSIADINRFSDQFSNRNSEISNTLKVPITGRNRAALQFPEDVTSEDALDQNSKVSARIEVDGIDIIKGYFKLSEVFDALSNIGGYYGLVIVGGNADWKNIIKEKTLDEINLTDHSHTWDESTIDASEAGTGFYLYPLINYGKFSGNSSYLAPYTVEIKDRRPAVNVAQMFEQILNDAGYTLESNFFKGGGSYGRNYFHTISGKDFNHSQSFVDARECLVNMNGNQIIDTPQGTDSQVVIELDDDTTNYNSTNNNFDTSNNRYVVDNNGYYRFKLKFRLETIIQGGTVAGGGNIEVKIRIAKGFSPPGAMVEQYYHVIANPHSTIQFNSTKNVQNTVESSWILCEANDLIRCVVYIDNGSNTNIRTTIKYGNTEFMVTAKREIAPGSEINFADILPNDVKQLDYIRNLKTIFNLHFVTDNLTRTVYCEPYSSFYSTTVVDWSDKVARDHGKKVTHVKNIPKKITYKYNQDSNDAFIEDYNKEREEFDKYAVELIENENIFTESEINFSVDLFAASYMKTAPEIGIPDDELLTLWQDLDNYPDPPDQSFDFEMRMFYYEGLEYLTTGQWRFENTNKGQFPKAYFVDEDSNDNYGLQFNDTQKNNGLVERFYKNIHEIFNNGKIVSFKMVLTPTDINNLDFRKKYQIDDDYYRLNKITNYNPLAGGLCDVELVTLVNERTAGRPVKYLQTKKYAKKLKKYKKEGKQDVPLYVEIDNQLTPTLIQTRRAIIGPAHIKI